MNFGTKVRSILVIATCLNTALMATDITQFDNGLLDSIYKIASVILNFIVVACATYYNNDFTEEACKATGQMRLMKTQAKGQIDGENFIDAAHEVPEVEDEHDI